MTQTTITPDGRITRDARSRYRARATGGAHGAFEAETRAQGKRPRAEVTVDRAPAPAPVAKLLATEDPVIIRARRMYADDALVQLVTTYIPADVADAAPAVAQLDTGQGGIITRMSEAGVDFAQTEVTEDVTQVPASAEEAEALGVATGAPLLTITHVGRTVDGRAVEVTQHTLGPGWVLRYGVPLS
ncbi:UTRA domain-containing protein [Streptomyces diastaticus]